MPFLGRVHHVELFGNGDQVLRFVPGVRQVRYSIMRTLDPNFVSPVCLVMGALSMTDFEQHPSLFDLTAQGNPAAPHDLLVYYRQENRGRVKTFKNVFFGGYTQGGGQLATLTGVDDGRVAWQELLFTLWADGYYGAGGVLQPILNSILTADWPAGDE